jgi:hypothetical protein
MHYASRAAASKVYGPARTERDASASAFAVVSDPEKGGHGQEISFLRKEFRGTEVSRRM